MRVDQRRFFEISTREAVARELLEPVRVASLRERTTTTQGKLGELAR
jgi:hypothetical protein